MDLIWSDRCGLGAAAKHVLAYLINFSKPDPKNPAWNMVWHGEALIEKNTSISERTVARAVHEIRTCTDGMPFEVTIERRWKGDGSGGRAPSIYRFRLPATVADKTAGVTRHIGGQGGGGLPAIDEGVIRQIGGGLPATVAEEPSKEPSKEPSHGEPTTGRRAIAKADRRKPETAIPDDFVPPVGVYEMARTDLGFDGARVGVELGKFMDHAAKEDRRARDWPAAFRLWLRKAKGFDDSDRARRQSNGAMLVQSADRQWWDVPEGAR